MGARLACRVLRRVRTQGSNVAAKRAGPRPAILRGMSQPNFIVSTADVAESTDRYPNSDEDLAACRAIGRAAGLQRIGLHVCRVPPGHRVSYPHAEEDEEEFVFVLSGQISAWINGELFAVKTGDLVAFSAGTGICHTFINDGNHGCVLLVGGESSKPHNRIYYPNNPERRVDLRPEQWWDDVPNHAMGTHDGKPRGR